jgi:MinD superfamily P-loop ATPase
MREIVVLSGKGGTGKTAVTSSLAFLAGGAVLADADVDAANLALVLASETVEEEDFLGMPKPVRDEDLCQACGLCRDKCRFDAFDLALNVDPAACEGCGLCARVCVFGALRMEPHVAGRVFLSRTPYGSLVHARLEPGEENSGKLVTAVRRRARALAEADGATTLLVDGPPGIGCPVIAALGGADLALLVAEPSVSGLHDLDRVLGLAEHFRVPAGVVVNKWDLAPDNTDRIRAGCEERGIPLLGRIPFDRSVVDAIVAGVPPVQGASGAVADALRAVGERVLGTNGSPGGD